MCDNDIVLSVIDVKCLVREPKSCDKDRGNTERSLEKGTCNDYSCVEVGLEISTRPKCLHPLLDVAGRDSLIPLLNQC